MKSANKKSKHNPFLKALSLQKVTNADSKYSAISLFSGGGGLDLGVSLAGFDVKFSSDVEPQLCETIKYNFPQTTVIAEDIRKLDGEKIASLSGTSKFDLLIGGPPCQSFSILGKRLSFQDPRGQLVYDYIRIVNDIKPKAFLFENVSGLLTVNGGKDWKSLLDYIENETGYKIHTAVLNAADFGIPQIRKRVFIVGFKNHKIKFRFPEPTHVIQQDGSKTDKSPWLPSKFALEDVDGLSNHDIRIHGERVKARYLQVPEGGRDKIDRTDRIAQSQPSGTVLVGSKAGGGRPFIHPVEPRHISVREAARLQSFPDWYVFKNTTTWQYRAVGNAVPPLLAKQIAEQISISLSN